MLLPYVQPVFPRSSPWGSITAPLRTGFDANHLIDRRLYGMAACKALALFCGPFGNPEPFLLIAIIPFYLLGPSVRCSFMVLEISPY